MTREYFKNLFEMYFEELRRYIFYVGGNAALADDIAQQTMLKIWEKQINILPGKERGLLFKIAKEDFIDHVRKEKLHTDFSQNFNLNTEVQTPEEELEYKELSIRITKALGKLKENQRVVFLLSRKEGMKYHEIAKCLDISVKAVEKRMNGALTILRKDLKR